MTFEISEAQTLQTQISGQVALPGTDEYEQLRHGFNLVIDHHPAAILVPENGFDVAAGVRFANAAGLGIAVQSTGHGQQTAAGSDTLLIVTSRMKAVQVEAEEQIVRAEAGVLWGEVVAATVPHRLAPLNGSSPHVGVVGYTLGGGIGWMARKYGLAADSVEWIDLVTADGGMVRASADENRDLFWGLLGGGGSFGVVTEIGFRVYPVASLYGGSLVYPADAAGAALRFFRDWVKTLPDELTSSITILKIPNMPQIPEAMRGKTQVIMRAAYIGDPADGAALIQPWLDWRAPAQNTFHQLPYREVGTISNDPTDPAAMTASNELFDDLSDEAIDIIVRYATNPASPLILNEIRHAGGAISRVAADANAIGFHDAQFYLNMGGRTPTPEAKAALLSYVEQYKSELKPYLPGKVYLNFYSSPEAVTRVKDAFLPASLARLQALKAQYDPDNRFRYSYQIAPAQA